MKGPSENNRGILSIHVCIESLCKIAALKKKDQKFVFKTDYHLMQFKSIAECSKSILQSFQPSLSYHLSLRFLFCLFLSGRFGQVLLYFNTEDNLAIVLSDKMFCFVRTLLSDGIA